MRAIVVLFFCVVLSIANVQSQVIHNHINLNGFTKAFSVAGANDYPLSNLISETGILLGAKPGTNTMFAVDARMRFGYSYNELIHVFSLREAYAGYTSTHFDMSMGRKILEWSRLDAYSIVNQVTPYDYFYLSPDNDDSRMPQYVVHTSLRLGGFLNWQIVAIPFFTPSVYRFDLFSMGENVSFVDAELPERSFYNAAMASRMGFDFSSMSLAMSFYRGYACNYGFNLHTIDFFSEPVAVNLIPVYHYHTTAGLDIEIPVKQFIVKAEAAYYHVADTIVNMALPHSRWAFGVAIERRLWGVNTVLQYNSVYTPDFVPLPEPAHNLEAMVNQMVDFNRMIFGQQQQYTHTVSLLLNRSLFYETLQLNGMFTYNVSTGEFLIRPSLEYKCNDNLSVSMGGLYMHGDDNTVFSHSSKVLNGAFLQMKVVF